MNIQEIIVYILIFAAVTYTVHSTAGIFIKKQEKNSCGCSSCDSKNTKVSISSLSDKNSAHSK